MNLSGSNMPWVGCSQRSNASAPTGRPLVSIELGLVMQAELILVQRALRRSCNSCSCLRALLFIEASKKL